MLNAFHFDTLVWDWPIAIYLLLVGISAGMITLTMLLKYYVPAEYSGKNPIVIATAIVAPLSVMVGLIILIFHLTRPMTFWYLMVFYKPWFHHVARCDAVSGLLRVYHPVAGQPVPR